MKIILLDLNYTLVENSQVHDLPYTYHVHLERYRQWLVDMVKPYYVILYTVRPKHLEKETLHHLGILTGWQPQESIFNDKRANAETFKRHALENIILPKHGTDPSRYFAIESNEKVHRLLKEHKIRYARQSELTVAGIPWAVESSEPVEPVNPMTQLCLF